MHFIQLELGFGEAPKTIELFLFHTYPSILRLLETHVGP